VSLKCGLLWALGLSRRQRRRAFSRKSNIAVVGDALCASLMIEAGRAVADRGCDARQYETRRLTPAGFRIPRHKRFIY